jgi:tRNA threonylcarbamoyl adenosine modification protein YeaZ
MTRNDLVLALETSSRIGSVALAVGPQLLDQSTFSAPLRHSTEIFPAIARLLDPLGRTPTEISQVHISVGPGSFTGLRIAVTIAKSMYLANRAKIITVDSLDVIAANVDDASHAALFHNAAAESSGTQRIATVLDAKRGQFFVAAYERVRAKQADQHSHCAENVGYRIPGPGNGLWRKVLPDCLMSAPALLDKFATEACPLHLLGDGLLYHRDSFSNDGTHVMDPAYWSPGAANVHRLGYQKAQAGAFSDPLTLVPFYLRAPQVTLRSKP